MAEASLLLEEEEVQEEQEVQEVLEGLEVASSEVASADKSRLEVGEEVEAATTIGGVVETLEDLAEVANHKLVHQVPAKEVVIPGLGLHLQGSHQSQLAMAAVADK